MFAQGLLSHSRCTWLDMAVHYAAVENPCCEGMDRPMDAVFAACGMSDYGQVPRTASPRAVLAAMFKLLPA